MQESPLTHIKPFVLQERRLTFSARQKADVSGDFRHLLWTSTPASLCFALIQVLNPTISCFNTCDNFLLLVHGVRLLNPKRQGGYFDDFSSSMLFVPQLRRHWRKGSTQVSTGTCTSSNIIKYIFRIVEVQVTIFYEPRGR